MPNTKSANHGKQNEESKRSQQSSMNDNRQKGSMSMHKTNKSETNTSKGHR